MKVPVLVWKCTVHLFCSVQYSSLHVETILHKKCCKFSLTNDSFTPKNKCTL